MRWPTATESGSWRPTVAAVRPEDAQPPQLVIRQRIGGARVAPFHVPRILEEHGAAILILDLPREHRLVEAADVFN